jgi:hypothetical protein
MVSKFTLFLAVLFGGATTATIVAQLPHPLQLTLSCLMTAISAANWIFDYRTCTDLHKKLRGQFADLEQEIRDTQPSEDALSRLSRRRVEIEKEEPGTLKNLVASCHNDVLRARGCYDVSEYLRLEWWQKLICHTCTVGPIPTKTGTQAPTEASRNPGASY